MIPSLERDATQFVGISLHGNERQRGSENKEAAHLNVKKKGRKKKKKRKIAFRTKRKKRILCKSERGRDPFYICAAVAPVVWGKAKKERKKRRPDTGCTVHGPLENLDNLRAIPNIQVDSFFTTMMLMIG